MHLNISLKLWLIFCCHQQKIVKMSHLWHFNDHNSESKHDNKTNDPIFSSTLWALSAVIFYFCISRPSKFNSMGSPLYLLVCKVHVYVLKMTLSSLLTKISFFYIKLVNFWYIICFVSNLISIWPQSYWPQVMSFLIKL